MKQVCESSESQIRNYAETTGMSCDFKGTELSDTCRYLKNYEVFVPKLQLLDSESVLLEPLEESHSSWVPEGICVFSSYTREVKRKFLVCARDHAGARSSYQVCL